MHFYKLGIPKLTLVEARQQLEMALGISFGLRSSDFLGGEYYNFRGSDGRIVKLYQNYDRHRRQFLWESLSQYSVVADVTDSSSPDDVLASLLNMGATVVRKATFEREEDKDDPSEELD